jgi:hypothetical protein
MVRQITKKATTVALSTLAMLILFTVSVSAAPIAAITFFMADSTTIAAGETVIFTLRTNSAANHVWAEVDGGVVSATVTNVRTGQTSWAVSVRPLMTQSIRLHAGITDGVSDSSVQMPVIVSGTNATAHPPITQATSENQRIYSVTEVQAIAQNAVTLEVVTGNNSNYAWVRFDGGRYAIGTLLSEEENRRTWQISYRSSQPTLRHTVQVSANRAYVVNGAANLTVNIELSSPFVPPVNPAITSVQARPSSIFAGRATVLTVRTNSDVNYVWAFVDGNRVNARRTAATSTSRTWTLNVAPAETQAIFVYGNHISTEGGAVSRPANITVIHETATIRSAVARWNSAGTQVQVTVVTNEAAEWVDLQIPGRATSVAMSERRNTGEITWTAIISPQIGWHNVPISIFAGDSGGGREVSRRINHIEGHAGSEASIFSVSAPSVSRIPGGNYEVTFTVVTDANTHTVTARAIDTGNFDMAHVSFGFTNLAQNQRHWAITVPISGATAADSTRFEIEAIGSGGLLPDGRHLAGSIHFR